MLEPRNKNPPPVLSLEAAPVAPPPIEPVLFRRGGSKGLDFTEDLGLELAERGLSTLTELL